MSTGLLILRLVMGIAMAAHGSQKLVGWFGGPGLKGFASYLEGIGFRPGTRYALAGGLMELLSGLLVVLGLGGPIGPALMMSVMLVATLTVHMGHGFFASTNGVELPFLYIGGAVALALSGAGQYSLDYLLGLDAVFPQMAGLIALLLGALAAPGNLAARDVTKTAIKQS